MRIFIAGAGGFVGGALVKRLAAHQLALPARDPEKFRQAGLRRLVIGLAPEVLSAPAAPLQFAAGAPDDARAVGRNS